MGVPMALDGLLLHALVRNIKEDLPAKVNKISHGSKSECILSCKTQGGKKNLIISCHSITNRINFTTHQYPSPEEPSSFIMLLRKHLEGSILVSIEQGGLDRFCKLSFLCRNTIGEQVYYYLYVELMGKYANMILVDETMKIVDALKRIPPFENNVRTIIAGAQFKEVEVQANKENPFLAHTIDMSQSCTQQFHGFSPLLSREITFRLTQGEQFHSIMELIKTSNHCYIYSEGKEIIFHLIPLLHLNQTARCLPLNEGLETVYYYQEEKDRIKDLFGNIFKVVAKELKHHSQKLPRLETALEEAKDCQQWLEYGEYLFSQPDTSIKGIKEIEVITYDGDNTLIIPLDSKIDLKGNAKKYFQKYNKGKKAQSHLIEQIRQCQEEIDYFKLLQQQLEYAAFDDAKQIYQELGELGYIAIKQSKIRKPSKKKDSLPTISSVNVDDVIIQFGKNNLQNDALTFKIANKNDTWLHIKDGHGSHVTINTDNPSEKVLRLAAMIAAYYSQSRYSSSIPVNYCLVRNLKKIPHSKSGLVSLSSYKTIYIDIDFDLLQTVYQLN